MATTRSPTPIRLPSWAPYWLVISALLMLMDCLFLLLRPHSFPGGRYHAYFTAYDTYTRYDPTYLDMHDAFINAQNVINLVELSLSLLALPLYYYTTSARPLAAYIVVLLSVSECSKTVLFFLYSLMDVSAGTLQYRLSDVSSWDVGYVASYLLPSMCWIIFPAWLIYDIGVQFIAAANSAGSGTNDRRKKQ